MTEHERDIIITFSDFDTQTRRAKLIGNAGAAEVLYFADERKVMFVQFPELGGITVTSVTSPSAGGEVFGVHSRHMWFGKNAYFSQWAGPCRVR